MIYVLVLSKDNTELMIDEDYKYISKIKDKLLEDNIVCEIRKTTLDSIRKKHSYEHKSNA